jgi:cytochrome c-type biogenesis protein CcmH
MPDKKGRVFFYLLACIYGILSCPVFYVDVVAAQTSSSDFTDVALERRYVTLIQELRCPKCQNQNLQDSHSAVSLDLKNQIQRLLKIGKSDEEIKSYLTERYTEYILYRPVVGYHTFLLWVGPLFFMLIAISVLLFVQRLNSGSLTCNKYLVGDQPHLHQSGSGKVSETFKKE